MIVVQTEEGNGRQGGVCIVGIRSALPDNREVNLLGSFFEHESTQIIRKQI